MPIVLCNAGPLMALGKLNRLDLLAGLYGEVQIPRAVYNEVVTQGLARGAPARDLAADPGQENEGVRALLRYRG